MILRHIARHAARALTAALVLAALPALAAPAGDPAETAPATVSGTAPASPDSGEPKPAEPGLKLVPDSFSEAIGTWDLSRQGGNNRCTLVLSSDNTPNGRVLRFPAGCRRALPALANAVAWLFADGGIRLVDRNVRPLLQFSASKDRSSLTAKAENGTAYALVPLETVAMLPPTPPAAEQPAPAEPSTLAAAAAAPQPASDAAPRGAEVASGAQPGGITSPANAMPGAQPVLPSGQLVPSPAAMAAARTPAPEKAAAPSSGSVGPTPGVYALDRFAEKDVCRLELESNRAAAKGGAEALASARILPGCRDSGIAMFEPVSWRFANGHMTLKAKRGHVVNLVPTGQGGWRRDPDVGTTFVLRKVER